MRTCTRRQGDGQKGKRAAILRDYILATVNAKCFAPKQGGIFWAAGYTDNYKYWIIVMCEQRSLIYALECRIRLKLRQFSALKLWSPPLVGTLRAIISHRTLEEFKNTILVTIALAQIIWMCAQREYCLILSQIWDSCKDWLLQCRHITFFLS